MTVTTVSDMGNIKIFSKDLSCFFANGFGDADNKVRIINSKKISGVHVSKVSEQYQDAEFLGHFTAKNDDEVFLSEYDCNNEKIHSFKRGRWFVYLLKPLHFLIERVDEETHS